MIKNAEKRLKELKQLEASIKLERQAIYQKLQDSYLPDGMDGEMRVNINVGKDIISFRRNSRTTYHHKKMERLAVRFPDYVEVKYTPNWPLIRQVPEIEDQFQEAVSSVKSSIVYAVINPPKFLNNGDDFDED